MRAASRDRNKEAFWRRTIGRQACSGLSVRAWCDKHSVRESSFYWWRTRLAQRDVGSPALAPVRVIADGRRTAGPSSDAFDGPGGVRAGVGAADAPTEHRPAGRMEIVLPRGRRVRIIGPVDRQALTDVLAVLRDEGADGATARAEPVRGGTLRKARSC